MNLNMFFGVLSFVLGLVKEVLIIFILIKGIQVANVYLKKNKSEKVEDNKDNKDNKDKEDKEDNTENTEDKEDKEDK